MQLLKNHAAESRLKSGSAHPSAFCIVGRKKSIDCRIEATLKGRRLLSLTISLNSFRLKRFACIYRHTGWFLVKKERYTGDVRAARASECSPASTRE